LTIKGRKVHIPQLGWVRLHEPLRFTGKVLEGTVSRTADCWFLSVTVEIPDRPHVCCENPVVVGVDLGVSALATLSTGEKIIGWRWGNRCPRRASLPYTREKRSQISSFSG
jgi:putative transposase